MSTTTRTLGCISEAEEKLILACRKQDEAAKFIGRESDKAPCPMNPCPTVEEQLDRFRPKASGVKFDAGKPPLSLINRRALDEEAQVMAYGALKYGRDNWRGGMKWSRLLDAAMRHIVSFTDGERSDPETGLHHLAHARCCLAFLLQYEVTHPQLDDRCGRKEDPEAKSL